MQTMGKAIPLRVVVLVLSIGLGLFAPWAGQAFADGWISACVDCPKYVESPTERNLCLDSGGHPHIAYGGDHLYYAWHDGTTWHYETADPSRGVGSYAALVLDRDGYPHISYHDRDNLDLKYAYKDALGWHVEIVDSEGQVGQHTSIALDQEGNPHIGYAARSVGELRYAHRNTEGWQVQTVEPMVEVWGGAMQLDDNASPHFLYWVRPSYERLKLRYAHLDGAVWSIEEIDEPEFTYDNLSLALDNNGWPHAAYYDEYFPDGALKYAYKDAAGWHITLADSGSAHFRGTPSLRLDAAGKPHIAYFDYFGGGPTEEIHYMYQDALGWHIEVAAAQRADSLALALAPDGRPRMSYLDGGTLHYLYRDAVEWHDQEIDEGADVGQDVSLAVGPDSALHISYYDNTNEDLKYARRTASGWQTETVASEGKTGIGSSLAIDGQERPCISYYADTSGEVLLSCRTPQGWQTETVDTLDWVTSQRRGSSLVFDEAGYPHISYRGGYAWQYAYKEATGWHVEEPDPYCPDCGYGSSLALDTLGSAHVADCDSRDDTLEYSYRDNEGWHPETVTGGDNCGIDRSLDLDNSNHPHISFYMGYHPALKYAYLDSGDVWQVETVAPDGYGETALALDANEYPHIAFGRYSNNQVGHAYWDGSTWQIEDVAYAGLWPSVALAFDDAGNLFIAYYDTVNKDLRYAFYLKTEYSVFVPHVLR